MVGSYRKRHIVDEEADWFSAGDYTPVFHLLLPQGEVDVALAVCADSDNSAVFADAARGGAQIVLHSSAPGLYGRRTDEASWQEGFDWYKSHLRERLPRYAREYGLYIAVATQTGATMTGFAFPNALLQHALGDLEKLSIDIGHLQRKRDRLVGALRDMGYKLNVPEGTFYLLVKAPIEDDSAFVEMLASHAARLGERTGGWVV